MMGSQPAASSSQQDAPHEPNWRLLYALVIGELAVTIVIFYIFTKVFA